MPEPANTRPPGDNPLEVNVNDSAAVAELAGKVGQLEAGTATKAEIEALRQEVAAIAASSSQTITRAEYNSLTAKLGELETRQTEGNKAAAEIKPPAPPPPTAEEIAAAAQTAQTSNNKGPAKFRVGLFRA